MRYLALTITLITFLYTFSFARYNWQHKKYLAAFGALFMALLALLLPFFAIYILG